MSTERTAGFRRNERLEELLAELNSNLDPAERALLEDYYDRPMERPLVLVMGPLRSGTTLFMQWLASTGLFAYPTNLLSRFYAAPIVGARIQLLLTDARYRFRDEIEHFATPAFESENGKTQGALAPNEFWYFWRRFLPEPDKDSHTDDELRSGMDVRTMKAELAGLVDVFERPFAAKGLLFNYNIPFLDSVFGKVLFVRLRRDPVTNVASVLDARRKQFGDAAHWYSFRIPEYEQLKDEDAFGQAAGQVTCINRAIERGLEEVDASRQLDVSYEAFCRNPGEIFEALLDRLGMTAADYAGPAHFEATRRRKVTDVAEIEAALARFG